MRVTEVALGLWLGGGLTLLPAQGRDDSKAPTEPREKEPEAMRVMVDRILARENELSRTLKNYSPRIETYLQSYESNKETGDEPTNDYYFFGRLDFGTMQLQSFLSQSGSGVFPPSFGGTQKKAFTFQHEMDGFVQAALVDYRGFSREHYQFQYVRSEFLGEVRCFVFELLPAEKAESGQFKGRIWVEDHDYTIVRFKGVRLDPPRFHVYYHFDSWRQELQPKLWLPTYIYAEESDLHVRMMLSPKSTVIRFRSQTRF